MVVRTIVVRPENHGLQDPLPGILARPRPMPVPATSLKVTFGVPVAGWIDFRLQAGRQVLEWDLSAVLDPFGRSREDHADATCITFLSWLERLAVGEPAAMFMDMEGPNAVLLVTAPHPDDVVEFFALGDPEAAGTLAVAMDRLALLGDVYTAVIAAWEGEIAANWPEWSPGLGPQWSLRSPLIEAALTKG